VDGALEERAATAPRTSIIVTDGPPDRVIVSVTTALDQSDPDLEVVVVGPRAPELVSDARVRHVACDSPHLAGQVDAALATVASPFVKILLPGDRLAPDCVASQIAAFAARPDLGVVFCSVEGVDESGWPAAGGRSLATPARARDEVLAALDGGLRIPAASALLRREALTEAGGLDGGREGDPVHDLWLRLLGSRDGVLVMDRLVRLRAAGERAPLEPAEEDRAPLRARPPEDRSAPLRSPRVAPSPGRIEGPRRALDTPPGRRLLGPNGVGQDDPEPPRSDRPRLGVLRRVAADAFLVVLVAVVYASSLEGGFVFDDRLLVVDNEMVAVPPWDLVTLFGPSEGGKIGYRPLRTLSYMIDYRLAGGLEPWAFHLSNLVYHALVVLVLHALARATLGPTVGALFAAAAFAVHPLGSEAVAYVSGRRDLLCALFGLLSLRAWWAFLDRRGRGEGRARVALVLAFVAGVAALGAKETALVLPILAGLLAVAHARRDPRAAAPYSLGALARVAVAVLFVAVVLYPDRFVLAWERLKLGPLAPQPALSLRVLGQYLSLAVWPATLLADYRHGAFALPTAPLDGPAALAGAALALVLAAGAVLLWRGHVAGAGLLWFVVALAPVAQVVPYAEVLSEHNAYLPLAGLCLAAGEGLDRMVRWRRRIALALAAVGVFALGGRTAVRSADWRDEVTLWTATVAAAPTSLRAHYNLGIAHRRDGRWTEAAAAFERALAIDPKDTDSLVALAEVSGRLGDYRKAVRLSRRSLRVEPTASAYTVLGWSKLALGNPKGARRTFRKALELDPRAGEALRGFRLARDQLRPPPRTHDDAE
jgi:tetratricopeptide (TPR) repeat protein